MGDQNNPSAFREWLKLDVPLLEGIEHEDRISHTTRFRAQVPVVDRIQAQWESLLQHPFKGVTSDGEVRPNLFQRRDDDIPITDITAAATALLAAVTPEQRQALVYPLDARERRMWSNTHFHIHARGLALERADAPVRDRVWALLRAATSSAGYAKIRASAHVNHFLGELVRAPQVLSEHTYDFLLFGEPSTTEPWGWLLYGHHICLSFFVWGTQMVISPVFLGAEPNVIDEGPLAGTAVFVPEQDLALKFVRGLPAEQRATARTHERMDDKEGKPAGSMFGWTHCGAFEDNRVVPLEGLRLSDVDEARREQVLAVVEQFVLYLPDTARRNRLEEVRRYLDETMFCWVGGDGDEDSFYYRIQSPVIICEFEHQPGIFLTNKEPKKFHIHTMVRTPNGGDYGHALLK